MSDPLRVALVAEGPTDRIVIEAAIIGLLGATPFILKLLQPEESLPFKNLWGGWPGVYHWCHQSSARAGGPLRHDPLFATFDLLILHLDADVANCQYADAGIVDPANDLPCDHQCPPPAATTNPLRAVLLRWTGEVNLPPKTILCTPSKSTEAWALCSLYPQDALVTSGNLECYLTPDRQLQAKAKGGRLISGGKKHLEVYRQRAAEITSHWPRVRACCSEAERFSQEFGVAAQPES
jgi:hypothetical protein